MTTVVALGDVHAPYQDDRAIALACKLLEAVNPQWVVHLADGIDFYQLSSFDKEPDRLLQLQDDLDVAYSVNKTLNSAAPDAAWFYLNDGNHEKRLWRYLCRHPEIAQLAVLDLANLLRLDDLHWTLSEPVCYLGSRLELTHGESYSKHAGWGAKKELERRFFQQSVLMGHTHKVGQYTARGPRHVVAGWEVGCLCTWSRTTSAMPTGSRD